jgi:hypothetical protein
MAWTCFQCGVEDIFDAPATVDGDDSCLECAPDHD